MAEQLPLTAFRQYRLYQGDNDSLVELLYKPGMDSREMKRALMATHL